MKTNPLLPTLLIALTQLLILQSNAQTTPKPAAPTKDDEGIVLSPLYIVGPDTTEYQATPTLAGSRIQTDLKDTSLPIVAVTAPPKKEKDK